MLLRLPSPGSLEPDVHETGAVLEAARDTFDRIVAHFEAIDPYPDLPYPQRCTTYSKPLLIRNMYKYARSEESQNVFLRAFFGWMELPMDSNADLDFQELAPRFSEVARYLIVKLFTPLRGFARETPSRWSPLHADCLKRDRYRCVISRKFDMEEYKTRFRMDDEDTRDDDGRLIVQADGFDFLKISHIIPHIPHFVMKSDSGGETDDARKAALALLNMLDNGVADVIAGIEIDRPLNALTLSCAHHLCFGVYDTHFDAVENQENTYTIETFEDNRVVRTLGLPVTRTLSVIKTRTIDPPSPRLLAVHRAIAHILHLSGAGNYIEGLGVR